MPLPKPNKDEKETDFISRCMLDKAMQEEFPQDKQRYAVCASQFSGKNLPQANKSTVPTVDLETEDDIQVNRFTKKTIEHQGKKHLVVPVVMMVEGVHAGSHGPLLHTANEFGKYTASWNGIPVVVKHPQKDGCHISANSPGVIDNQAVGRIYNTKVEDGKLKAEAWLEEDKLVKVSQEAASYIRQGRQLDVSIGVFTDDDFVTGDWNGEAYSAVAKNHRPDHLALLPGEKGACSWEDGCGIRTNQEGEEPMKRTKKGGVKTMACCEEKVELLVQSEHTGFDDDDREWLQDLEEPQVDKLIAMAKAAEKEEEEEEEDDDPDDMKILTAENDELKAEVARLKADLAKLQKAPKKGADEPQMNKETAIQVLKEQLNDPEQFIELLPQTYKEQMEHGLRLYQEHRTKTIDGIKANTQVYTDEELTAMSTPALEKLSQAVVKPKRDYSGQGGGNVQINAAEKEILLPPGVKEA